MARLRPARRRMALAALIATLAASLAGCSGQDPADTASSQDAQVEEVAQDEGAAEGDAQDCETPACAEMIRAEEVTRWGPEVPLGELADDWSWDLGAPEVGTYDPCAALSGAVLMLDGGSSASAAQIMLFHRGEYVGTPSPELYDGLPAISRVDDATIRVEPRSGPVVLLRWDEATQSVVPEEQEAAVAAPPVPGAFPGAGGPAPAGATPAAVVQAGTALIQSPSGNILCDLQMDGGGCGVLSSLQDQPHGVNETSDGNWWVHFGGGGVPTVGGQG